MKFFYYFLLDISYLLIIIANIEQPHINKNLNNYGLLKIGDLEETFVVASNNQYYLNHDLYGNYDIKGSIFLDYRTKINDKILILYGHNSQNVSVPFKYLENYYDEEFFNNHQMIEIYLNDTYLEFIIYSVFIATNDFFYMNLDLDYQEYIDKTKKYSWYDNNISVNVDDDIIILQTCSYNKKYSNFLNKYLLVIGKKIKT